MNVLMPIRNGFRRLVSRVALAAIISFIIGISSAFAQTPRRALDTTTFVVLGEGLAAGMANYGLSSVVQSQSFPAQVARQMQTAFPQPLIEPPGIGDVLGYQHLPLRLPRFSQGRVREYPSKSGEDDEGPTLFVFNLSVPGLTLSDSISRKPTWPVLQRDSKQTAINLILGFPALLYNWPVPLWSQSEYAQAMAPTLALIELGYFEALEAMVAGDPSRLPLPADFRVGYSKIVSPLRSMYSEVVVTTIPDPTQTAYLSTINTAASITRVPAATLQERYKLQPNDLITRNALTFISNQNTTGKSGPLPPGSVLSADVAAAISERVNALNREIRAVAAEKGAVVYDLAALFRAVRTTGLQSGAFRMTGDYLGGFYSLDGYYPGITGHAVIANEIIALLNSTYRRSFPMLNIAAIAQTDPALRIQQRGGNELESSTIEEAVR
jgi:hypothetical protein